MTAFGEKPEVACQLVIHGLSSIVGQIRTLMATEPQAVRAELPWLSEVTDELVEIVQTLRRDDIESVTDE